MKNGRKTVQIDAKSIRAGMPTVAGVTPVAADMVCIEIRCGAVRPHRLLPYEKKPGDRIVSGSRERRTEARVVVRNGRRIGWLAGPSGDHICLFERFAGKPLDETQLSELRSYTIRSRDDHTYERARLPLAVFRKSKPIDMTDPGRRFVMSHRVYLRLPAPLRDGAAYTIRLRGIDATPAQLRYCHRPRDTISEAVHVSHIGFRPDDPRKGAFLSLWLGSGGAHAYRGGPGLRFHLIDQRTAKTTYSGEVALAKAATDIEWMYEPKNHNNTFVYRMDFSAFDRPGEYRVYVEGVGCSPSFAIGNDTWRHALQVSMKGFYHMRSGIELGPPYTEYRRPRCYHPDDGITVYHSTAPIMETGNGLNVYKTDTNNFGNLTAGKTDTIVPDAWGGYHDAADWDRRIQHLSPTRLHLELCELFPGYVAKLALTIPESGNGIPDMVNEALWNLDCYRRMQTPEGGVRGGIEATGHPVAGDTSWLESQTIMAYAPGMWATHVYASVAARAAIVLRKVSPERSAVYCESAGRAMRWAEREWRRYRDDGAVRDNPSVKNTRNLAALEMYRLTGARRWHRVFLEHTQLRGGEQPYRDQPDAVFLYARLGRGLGDPALKRAARAAVIAAADDTVAYARDNAFGLASSSHDRPITHCCYSVPQAMECVRAHALTGKRVYLEAAIGAAQFSAGANPMNMTYTTGLGHAWPRHPMHIDSRRSGQPVPAGITVYGQGDNEYFRAHGSHYYLWMIRWFLDKACTPSAYVWPPVESYFDVNQPPSSTEYTPQQTMGPASYVWGYLAARE